MSKHGEGMSTSDESTYEYKVTDGNIKSCGVCPFVQELINGVICDNEDFRSRVDGDYARLSTIQGFTARCDKCLVKWG